MSNVYMVTVDVTKVEGVPVYFRHVVGSIFDTEDGAVNAIRTKCTPDPKGKMKFGYYILPFNTSATFIDDPKFVHVPLS